MAVYLGAFIFISLYGLFGNVNKSKNRKKIFLIISFGLLTIISGLRKYKVGIDVEALYYPTFKKIQYISWGSLYSKVHLEIGYAIFNKLIQLISLDFQKFLFAISLFINFSFARFIYKNSRNVAISTMLYIMLDIFFVTMCLIRQEIAVCILLYAFEFVKKDKKLPSVAIILLAMSFHTSAAIGFIYIVMEKIKFDYKKFFAFLIVTIIIMFSLSSIVISLSNYLDRIVNSNNKDYSYYLSGKNEHGAGQFNLTSLSYLIIAGVIFIGAFLVLNKKTEKEKRINFLLIASFLNVFFNICIIKIGIMGRLRYYFLPFMLLIVPEVMIEMKKSNTKDLIMLSFFGLLTARTIIFIYKLAQILYGVMPYYFFWQ